MQVLESATATARLLPPRRGQTAAIDPDAEPSSVADRPPVSVTEAHSGSVQTEYSPRQISPRQISPGHYSTGHHSTGPFTAAEVRNMQRDDAMAAGMITVILSLAFVVLLSLTICVNIWMLRVSP